ncbi:hypothetical protein EJ110_NYTH33802 [Nymphaea thermarum]|nr:hypothetical protein EJ110_NYTH33802 [Nymphaea thermarum]
MAGVPPGRMVAEPDQQPFISNGPVGSSARNAKASTSLSALTVLVEDGRLPVDLGSKAHESSSSPQKSPGFKAVELKKPVLPPLVVELSSCPRIMNSISVTGSPSRTMYVPSVLKLETRRSHMASNS